MANLFNRIDFNLSAFKIVLLLNVAWKLSLNVWLVSETLPGVEGK